MTNKTPILEDTYHVMICMYYFISRAVPTDKIIYYTIKRGKNKGYTYKQSDVLTSIKTLLTNGLIAKTSKNCYEITKWEIE